ncbi:MAG: VOC family protein [Patescibacteria group bacterium]
MITLNPYLHFKDNAREAMEFYKSVFGGTLDISTFKDAHMSEDPTEGEKVMHAMLVSENGLTLMGADTPSHMEYKTGATISVSLSGDDYETLKKYWEKLSEGGTITVPFEKAPWGDTFGMLTDKYGIEWLVDVLPPKT